MPNSTTLKTLTLSDGTYNNTLPLEDTTARNSIASLAASLAPVATSGSYNDLLNKPSLAAVATSGSYNDLTDVPSTTGTLEVVFSYETDHYECDTSIEDMVAALDDNTRVIAKIDVAGMHTDLYEVSLYYADNYSKWMIFSNYGEQSYLKTISCYVSGSGAENWSYSILQVASSSDLANKQDTLVSGTNIKTINGQSLLGSGNISIQGSGGGEANIIETVKVNGTALVPDANKAVDVTVPTQTSQLINNSGFLTSHQDISGKADRVSGSVTGHIAELDANGNLADGGVLASDVEDAVTKKHTHSNKAYLDKIPSSNGTNGQVLTSDGTSWSWQTPSSGGLTNYDYAHTPSTFQSGTVAVTFAANQRCSVMYGASADLALAITCNNGADNYIWVQNTGTADIDITISSVTYNNSSLAASNIFLPSDGITVPKGCVCEIGVLCNADGAFITARGDLKASS